MSEPFARTQRVPVSRADNPSLYIQRLFTQFLQGLFNFNPVGCLHWEPDVERTEVVIAAEAPLDMRAVGKRPAITVVMGPEQGQGLGVDQLLSMNLSTEECVHSDLNSGHIVVYCLAESDVVARWMSNVVKLGTLANRRLLESPGGFHQVARPAISVNPPSPPGGLVAGDPKGLVMVQTNVPYSFQWTWSEEPRSPSNRRSLNMITANPRASDYDYPSLETLKRVELGMSSTPVYVRRLGASSPLKVHDGISGLQAAVVTTGIDED